MKRKINKIRLGVEYSLRMRQRFSERKVQSKKVYSKSNRRMNKIKL